MSARVFCFASARGGAGATTIALSVGTLLAGRGHTTLLVDAAPAPGGLTYFYLHTLLERRDASSERLSGICEASDQAQGHFSYAFVSTQLAVIPAFYYPGEQAEATGEAFAAALVQLVQEASSLFDYIILDAPPITDRLAQAAARLADQVFVVTECDALSFAHLERTEQLGAGPFSAPARWLLPNKVTGTSTKLLQSLAGCDRVLSPIPDDREVRQAVAARLVPIDVLQPNLFTIALIHAFTGFVGTGGYPSDQARDPAAETVRQDVVNRYRLIAAERDSLRTRYLQLAARSCGPQPLSSRSVMFATAAAVASVVWLAAGGAIALGANPAWRALGFLLVIAGASTGMLTWYLLTRRMVLRGDGNDAIMELEAIEERLAELAEQQQKWRPLFEHCAALTG